MQSTRYPMTKEESEALARILKVKSDHELVVAALDLQFRAQVLVGTFKRFNIPETDLERAIVDVGTGTIEIVPEPPKREDEKKTEENKIEVPSEKEN